MLSELRVEIGGIGLIFRYKRGQLEEPEEDKAYAREFICTGKNDFIIDVEVGRLPEYSKDKMLFEAKENWRSYLCNGEYIFETRQSNSDRIDQVCVIAKSLDKAKVYIASGADEYKLNSSGEFNAYFKKSWSLESFMRGLGQLIFICILPKYQGLLIHCSGVIVDGEGIIFAGISGAGKTTLAKLCRKKDPDEMVVLSDDRLIVRKEKEGYFVYGTPWPGEGKIVSPQKAPLRKIFFLAKAKENGLILLEKKESLRRLVAQCFPAVWDRESIDFSLGFCAELVQDITCFSFGFVPDASAVDFILSQGLS